MRLVPHSGPILKPERQAKECKPLGRGSELKRSSSKPKQTPLGHCTEAQKERVANQVCIGCGKWFGERHPAHVVPRGHPKMSQAAADDVRAVVPLCFICHGLYDEGKIDLLPNLEPAWRDSQEWAAGAVGLATALRAITGEQYIPESEADRRVEAVYREAGA